MPDPGLTSLQRRVLACLAGSKPPWTLTGGGALVGFHLRHRTTRDLDLFWHGREELGDEREGCIRRLRADGFAVESLQREPHFERLLVSDGQDRVVLDLVAEPVECVEQPQVEELDTLTILVDTPHEILVNKLCALLGRAELRDLIDVRALVVGGTDLVRALEDAPRKDGGFSVMTLAWVLRGLPIEELADAAGIDAAYRESLSLYRDALVEDLILMSRPEAGQAD
jgi:Nucleotidyl transferase AbiEii toxin, Type IV TA system